MRILVVLIAFLIGGVAGAVVGRTIYTVKINSGRPNGGWLDRHLERQNWLLGGALAGGVVGAVGAVGALAMVDRRRKT